MVAGGGGDQSSSSSALLASSLSHQGRCCSSASHRRSLSICGFRKPIFGQFSIHNEQFRTTFQNFSKLLLQLMSSLRSKTRQWWQETARGSVLSSDDMTAAAPGKGQFYCRGEVVSTVQYSTVQYSTVQMVRWPVQYSTVVQIFATGSFNQWDNFLAI